MPTALHDFTCPACGSTARDFPVPMRLGARCYRPICGCGTLMTWIPQVGRMDALEPFQRFTTSVLQPDGSHKEVLIDSLSAMRRVERETEIAERNGEGQRMIWRDYSQDRSNRDVHTCGPDPATVAREEVATARARLSATRHGARAPEVTLGAGVTEATVSALGE